LLSRGARTGPTLPAFFPRYPAGFSLPAPPGFGIVGSSPSLPPVRATGRLSWPPGPAVSRNRGEAGMIRQRVRTAPLASIFAAPAPLPVRAGDGACGPPAPPCAPAVRTIHVTEWVPQHVETVRTVYRTECVSEKYIAYRTECVPEVRTRVVTVHRLVPEVREE